MDLGDDLLADDDGYLLPNDGLRHTSPERPTYLHSQYTLSPGGYADADSADRLPHYSMLYGAEGADAEADVQHAEHGERGRPDHLTGPCISPNTREPGGGKSGYLGKSVSTFILNPLLGPLSPLARLASLADHMAAASPAREAPAQVMQAAQQALPAGGRGAGPALTEDELLMACGAFNPDKYDEYNRQVGGRSVAGTA